MTESATSETTSRLRKRLLDRLRCAGRSCDALRAGANPKTRLVRIAAATANSTAGALIRTVCQRNSWGEPKRMNNSSTQPPIAIPAAPEIAASSRLSVSSCRTIRARPAPSAMRRPISFWRAVARASSRLATFTQPISNTMPTAPSSTSSGVRNSPATESASGSSSMFQSGGYQSGRLRVMRAATSFISERARSRVTPDFSRATTSVF